MAEGGKIAVTGASGLVGTELVRVLRNRGVDVLRLVRRTPAAQDEVEWNPASGSIDVDGLAGIRGAIHLAGDNVASGRWTEAKKACIRDSRVQGTGLLSSALAQLSPRPEALVSASAIGYYGSTGDQAARREQPARGGVSRLGVRRVGSGGRARAAGRDSGRERPHRRRARRPRTARSRR